MIDEDKLKQAVIQKATELFFKFGYTNTTTQQIAEELEISKKTIYKYFPSKESLLETVMEQEHQQMTDKLSTLANDNTMDFVEKATRLSEAMVIGSAKLSPQFIKDLQKVRFSSWCCQQYDEQILVYLEKMVRQGIDQGLIRKDVNIDLVLLMVACIQGQLNFAMLSQIGLTLTDGIAGIVRIVNQGILTEAARQKYE